MSKNRPECPLYNHLNCKEHINPKVCAIVRDDKQCLKKGLILVTAGPTRNVIRILVPLSAQFSLVEEGLDILEACLEEATA